MPVKLLNSLGARASTEMLARYIQHYHYVDECEKRGPEKDCLPNTLTIDDIDFMRGYFAEIR